MPKCRSPTGNSISRRARHLSFYTKNWFCLRQDERKIALLQLIKMTRKGISAVWDEHFKTILSLLLETLKDNDSHMRALSIQVLREILKSQPDRFEEFAELTILKILEAHNDPSKEVIKAADMCISTLATTISPELCMQILNPVVRTGEDFTNLSAIKMQTRVIEQMHRETLKPLLPDIIPGLLKAYESTESCIRKASVFCLVALHQQCGYEIHPHLIHIKGSMLKLLHLYIKRAENISTTEDDET